MHRLQHTLTILDPPLTLFLLSSFLALWPAYDRSLCWNTLAALVAGFLLHVLVSRCATRRRRWRAVAWVFVVASVVLSLYYVTQRAHFGHGEKMRAVHALTVLIGKIVPPSAIWAPWGNSVATFLEGPLFLGVALALTEKRRRWRIGGCISTGLIALALLMSESRGAWLAVALVSLLWLALHWRPARWVAAVVVVSGLSLMIYVTAKNDITVLDGIPVANRVLAPVFIRQDRLDVYRNSLYLIQDFPLTGIGLGDQFAMVYSRYVLLIRVPFLTYSHNLYLEVWLQHGLLGATALLWLVAALCQAARTETGLGADLLHQGTSMGLAGILVHGITDARQYVDLWCWFPFFGLLGLNAAILLRRAPAMSQKHQWLFPAGLAGLFLLVVMLSLLPLTATLSSNLGCALQARAELPESLDPGRRAVLRQQAADQYRRAIRIASEDRTAQQRLGLILMDEGQFHDAVGHLRMALRADPDNTTTHKLLGLAYVWVGALEGARPLLQNVPDIVEELNVWGWWRDTQHQTEQAVNAYRMSLELEPDQPQVQRTLERLE